MIPSQVPSTGEEIRARKGTWVLLAPVENLTLSSHVDRELRVNRVTFVAAERLPYVRRRLGLPHRVSELRDRSEALDRYFFDSTSTFAVMRLTGVLGDLESTFLQTVREEIAILGASWLGFRRARHAALPSFSSERPKGTRSYLFLHDGGKVWTQPNMSLGALGKRTDHHWLRACEERFFFKLLRILRDEAGVTKSWRNDLHNAAVLIGQSQASKDLPTAFLFNMIALELLLTRQGDVVGDALPERTEAFLGWVGDWKSAGFEKRIRDVYEKRCRFVHQGVRREINPVDVVFSDELISNVLTNLVWHPEIFDSKDAVVEFSEKVRAERLLGIDAGVRPRTLKASWRTNLQRYVKDAF